MFWGGGGEFLISDKWIYSPVLSHCFMSFSLLKLIRKVFLALCFSTHITNLFLYFQEIAFWRQFMLRWQAVSLLRSYCRLSESRGPHRNEMGCSFQQVKDTLSHTLLNSFPCALSIPSPIAFVIALFFPARSVRGKIHFFLRCQPLLLWMLMSLQLLDKANGQKHLKGCALWFRCHNPCNTHQTQRSLTSFQPIIIGGWFKLQVWLNL